MHSSGTLAANKGKGSENYIHETMSGVKKDNNGMQGFV
jgi:hypothetical protein